MKCTKNLIAIGVTLAALLTTTHAYADCVPAVFPADWLDTQELLGGHTIDRHVGKTDQELVDRLLDNQRITAASTYFNYGGAQQSIETVMTANAAALNVWANQAAANERTVFESVVVNFVGRVASRPASPHNIANSNQLRGVLVADGNGGCYLLTSFPV